MEVAFKFVIELLSFFFLQTNHHPHLFPRTLLAVVLCICVVELWRLWAVLF